MCNILGYFGENSDGFLKKVSLDIILHIDLKSFIVINRYNYLKREIIECNEIFNYNIVNRKIGKRIKYL